MARQLIFAQYGSDAYTRGLNVYTTSMPVNRAAYKALREGIMDYERRQKYRGPEKFITLPSNARSGRRHRRCPGQPPRQRRCVAAVVLEAASQDRRGPCGRRAFRDHGRRPQACRVRPQPQGTAQYQDPPRCRDPRHQERQGTWEITQLPEVEGAFVAMSTQTGAIRALVGGFDFEKNKFNHVTQAWRQPAPASSPSSTRRRWNTASRRPP
jgi:penicillin-binding protein 1A